jgi:hypothetical protein
MKVHRGTTQGLSSALRTYAKKGEKRREDKW